jgi:hypothetical protein
MTLRPEYALGHSPYNAFLFAAVGEEQVGVPLTVLSALTRLGFDPWEVAARLSDLPREAATQSLATMIAKLPEGNWKASDSGAIAARLVHWLPGQSAHAVPPMEAAHIENRKMKTGLAKALAWAVLAAAVLFFTLHVFSSNNLEVDGGGGGSTQQ